MKRKKKKKEAIASQPKPKIKSTLYETTDRDMVDRLTKMGFMIKEIRSPFGDRKEKLYVFYKTAEQIKEAVNGCTNGN